MGARVLIKQTWYEITGKPIELVELSGDDLKTQLTSVGVPRDFAMLNAAVDANARAGKAELVNDAIAALIRREPLHLRAFLEANTARLLS